LIACATDYESKSKTGRNKDAFHRFPLLFKKYQAPQEAGKSMPWARQ
jgi:hypothetical protein